LDKTFEISGRKVGDGRPCFIIAEIGSNHNHNFDQAKELIDAAANAGVDAVKFQTFRASSHYSKRTPKFDYLEGASTYDLISSLEIDRSWHRPLKDYSESVGLIFLSSPCDSDAVSELSDLGMEAFKVASFDLPDQKLIEQMAQTNRPLILSTGMADWMDIQRAVDIIRKHGNDQIALLQCTSLYPAPPELCNLKSMSVMKQAFQTVTGYSDHTEGDHACIAAVALGASIIEKHFTLDRNLPGPDHKFAIEPDELSELVKKIRDVESAIGDGNKSGPRSQEIEMYNKGRRSLHTARKILKDEVIVESMLTIKRPGLGIPPYMIEQVLGRKASQDIDEDQWLTWEML
jgi:sialic acid synthase SpsE